MADHNGVAVAVGCEVRIRSVVPAGRRFLPDGIKGDDPERVVTIVAPPDAGLYRLTTRMPLGRALVGHRAGDLVRVAVEACTVEFEVLAVKTSTPTASTDAGVAELEEGMAGDVGIGDPIVNADRAVRVGDVVHVLDGQLQEWWRIVSKLEADALRRWISEETPLAQAVLGHRAGEVVGVRAPGAPVTGWPVRIVAIDAAAP
jgi:transcription elongation GreA/GreB family factor